VARRAFKLFRVRRDGTLGSLFINASAVVPIGQWLKAEHHHHVKGFAYRPAWHCVHQPVAPHMSMEGRAWFEVEIEDYEDFRRPGAQGGLWFLAQRMMVIGPVKGASHVRSSEAVGAGEGVEG